MAQNYYIVIKGKKYDRRLVELAEALTSGKGDGRISIHDAKTLLSAVKDSNSYSPIEKLTMQYIRSRYKFTKEGDTYFRGEIRKWAATKKSKTGSKASRTITKKASTTPASAAPVSMAPEKITPNTDNKSEQKKPSPIKQIFLVLLLLIFLAALFYFFTQRFQCNKAPTPTTTQTVPVVNPPHVPPITAELKNFIESTKLNFVAEKTTLTPQTEKTLDALAGRLNGQNLRLQITGHTCSLGPRALNQKISEERAAIVKSALVARGVDAKNIETKGVADSESIADNNTPAGRAQNRRVSFKVLE